MSWAKAVRHRAAPAKKDLYMVKSFLLPEENAAATVFLENDFLLLISSIHCLHVKFVPLFDLGKSGCNHFDYGLTCYNSMHWRKSTRTLLSNATEGKPRRETTKALNRAMFSVLPMNSKVPSIIYTR
jgi:hypothetical protein